MIKNIIFALLFLCLLIALSIKLIDSSITYVELGVPFMSFLKNCSIELNNFKIAIPSIPKLELQVGQIFEINNAWDVVRYGFYQIVALTHIIDFLNGLLGLINFVITILNVFISVLQFIFIVLKNLIVLRDTLIATA